MTDINDGDNSDQLSQPINEELFVERSFETSTSSSEEEDSEINSGQDLFRPSTPLSEIEREKEEKRNMKLNRTPAESFYKPGGSTIDRTANLNKPGAQQYKSSCCLLI